MNPGPIHPRIDACIDARTGRARGPHPCAAPAWPAPSNPAHATRRLAWQRVCVAIASAALSLGALAQAAVVATGKSVSLEYTVTLDDGTVVDSSAAGGALTYVQGDGEMLPALEAALAGMAVNERKSIRLEPAEAYGPFDPDAFREVPIENVPESARRVGAQLRASGTTGTMRVHEVRESTIVLDYNHPLAGQSLTFDVEVVSIE